MRGVNTGACTRWLGADPSWRAHYLVNPPGPLSDIRLSFLHVFLGGLDESAECFVLPPLLEVGEIMVFCFLLELEVALMPVLAQCPVLHCQQDCASRFLGVRAVREAAVHSVFVNLEERVT